MAIYRLSAKIVKRSDGRSVVAAAAYRAGVNIFDERTGLLAEYIHRRGVLHAEILAPPGTNAPLLDRAFLWNTVEAIERRRDAQLAREIELALPFELTPDQRLELVREFVGREFVARGMIADLVIHEPDGEGDPRNHHAHVLLTLRSLADDNFGPKVREWNDTELLEHWRLSWADAVNLALATHGHTARVDHRSYVDRGVSQEPEPKIGPTATTIERAGRRSRAGDARRAVRTRNRKRRVIEEALDQVNAALDMTAPTPTASPMATPSEVQGREVSDALPELPGADQAAPTHRSAPRKSAGWTRYVFAMWTTVARALTSPFRTIAAVVTRRSLSDLKR